MPQPAANLRAQHIAVDALLVSTGAMDIQRVADVHIYIEPHERTPTAGN